MDRSCQYRDCQTQFIPQRSSQRYCEEHKERRGHNNKKEMREKIFLGVDGEGTGRGKDHKYVLLGCGDQYTSWNDGLTDINDVWEFLYTQYEKTPDAIFAGFFLPYDFNMWLRCLPRERAAMLLTDQGIAKRTRKINGHRLPPFPVDYQGWQFDMLGYKRLKLAPKGSSKWMYVNDTGPFFQTSFMKVIDPSKWTDNPVVTKTEYAKLGTGKERRSTAVLDNEMIGYMLLENDALARVLERLNEGFNKAGVRLDKRQWFGPGQAAQKWMSIDGKLDTATRAIRDYDRVLHRSIVASYYGGWFEIPAHGIVPGTSYEYDINSAYPYAIAGLPCCCGSWTRGKGTPRSRRVLLPRLCKVTVAGHDSVLGPLPYRRSDGRVLRPQCTTGWYWQHEIDAAQSAGLIDKVEYHEYWEYEGCGHKPPMRGVSGLYDQRLRIGKDTPYGKSLKLLLNSFYGKFAQSVGDPRYGNALYASLITSYCRTQILDAIATHPQRSKAVLMVATDAIYFTSPHPSLPISNKLGEWSAEQHEHLTLFKPGVYWNDKTRQRIRKNEAVAFKARGISANYFAASIQTVDDKFADWESADRALSDLAWPKVEFKSGFSQISITQALAWTNKKQDAYRALAGQVMESRTLTQSADPSIKRDGHSLYRDEAGVWRTRPWTHKGWSESTPYSRQFGWDDERAEFDQYATPDGSVLSSFRDILGVG